MHFKASIDQFSTIDSSIECKICQHVMSFSDLPYHLLYSHSICCLCPNHPSPLNEDRGLEQYRKKDQCYMEAMGGHYPNPHFLVDEKMTFCSPIKDDPSTHLEIYHPDIFFTCFTRKVPLRVCPNCFTPYIGPHSICKPHPLSAMWQLYAIPLPNTMPTHPWTIPHRDSNFLEAYKKYDVTDSLLQKKIGLFEEITGILKGFTFFYEGYYPTLNKHEDPANPSKYLEISIDTIEIIGSVASGTSLSHSDVDLVLTFTRPMSFSEVYEAASVIKRKLNFTMLKQNDSETDYLTGRYEGREKMIEQFLAKSTPKTPLLLSSCDSENLLHIDVITRKDINISIHCIDGIKVGISLCPSEHALLKAVTRRDIDKRLISSLPNYPLITRLMKKLIFILSVSRGSSKFGFTKVAYETFLFNIIQDSDLTDPFEILKALCTRVIDECDTIITTIESGSNDFQLYKYYCYFDPQQVPLYTANFFVDLNSPDLSIARWQGVQTKWLYARALLEHERLPALFYTDTDN